VGIGGLTFTVEINLSGSTWESLGDDPQEITIERGRDDELSATQMGRCTVRLHDHTGKYAAENSASPLYPYLRPMKGVRVTATYLGVDYLLFRGFLSRCETNPDYGTQEATLEAVDLFYKLGQVLITSGPATDTSVGSVIGTILDAIGWTDPALRDLDAGDSLPYFHADGTASGLDLIGRMLEVERGQFYISRAGVATYESRHARLTGARAVSQATVSASLAAVTPGIDVALIRNRATVTRAGGVPQTHTDATSATEFGTADFPAIESAYLRDDNQALSLAAYLVSTRKDPIPTARRLRLVSDVADARLPMLERDLGDRITAVNALTGISGDFHIESIRHVASTSDMRLTTTWGLTKRPAANPFIVGASLVGGPDVVVY
jgi:hypothetical protein